jgi:hypothetical protein
MSGYPALGFFFGPDCKATIRSSRLLFGIAFAASLRNQKRGCLVRANETGMISGLYEKATDSAV